MGPHAIDLSIAELRRRYLREEEPVTAQLLARLKRDPRQGVRLLHDTLRRRWESEKQLRARRDSMLHFERILWRSGIERLAGVDEAGVGPLAGPVVAAAVVFPPGTGLDGVDDSKQLDRETRERLDGVIRGAASGIGLGTASVAEIDELNVYQAALLAMRRAVEDLPDPPQHLLVDARAIPGVAIPQNRFEKGDGIDFSIAAASILAKVHRDALMQELDREYPEYGFAAHKGYATPGHQEAIRRHGPCPAHRRSYTFLRELCGGYSERFYRLQERLEAIEERAALRRFETDLSERREELADEEYRKLRLTVTRRWKGM
jgi:ribonuclease HII